MAQKENQNWSDKTLRKDSGALYYKTNGMCQECGAKKIYGVKHYSLEGRKVQK